MPHPFLWLNYIALYGWTASVCTAVSSHPDFVLYPRWVHAREWHRWTACVSRARESAPTLATLPLSLQCPVPTALLSALDPGPGLPLWAQPSLSGLLRPPSASRPSRARRAARPPHEVLEGGRLRRVIFAPRGVSGFVCSRTRSFASWQSRVSLQRCLSHGVSLSNVRLRPHRGPGNPRARTVSASVSGDTSVLSVTFPALPLLPSELQPSLGVLAAASA